MLTALSALRCPLGPHTCSAADGKHQPCAHHVCNRENIWNSVRLEHEPEQRQLLAQIPTLTHSWVKRPGKE